MPRPQIKQTSTCNYVDSPLAQVIQASLEKITELKRAYKKEKKSPDFELAQKQVEIVEEFLKKIDGTLRRFDNFKSPGLYEFMSDLRPISDLSLKLQKVIKSSDGTYSLSISHPMICELALFVAEIMQQLPRDLSQVIPFFDPKAFDNDLSCHTGFNGWLVKKSFGSTFHLKLIESPTPIAYEYQFTNYVKEKEVTETIISGVRYYHEYYQVSFDLLTSTLPRYFHDYADTPLVQNEQVRAELLQKLVSLETKLLHELFKELPSKIEEEALQVQDRVQLEQLNEQLIQRLIDINTLKQKTSQLAASYETVTVKELLAKHADLALQFESLRSSSLDVTFGDESVPNYFLAIDGVVVSIAMKDSFIQTISLNQESLEMREKLLIEQQQILSAKLAELAQLDAEKSAERVTMVSESAGNGRRSPGFFDRSTVISLGESKVDFLPTI